MKTMPPLAIAILLALAMPGRTLEPAVGVAGESPVASKSQEEIVFFKSTAETGDLSEWVGDGGGTQVRLVSGRG